MNAFQRAGMRQYPDKKSIATSAIHCAASMFRAVIGTTLLCCGLAVPATAGGQDDAAYFRDEVEPVLRKQCFICHSHAAELMEGGLALDWRSGWETGGSRGPAVVPGDAEQSLLIRAIQHVDPDLQMPEEKLPDNEIAVLTRWVETGAFDDRKIVPHIVSAAQALDWWSLKPLTRPEVPGEVSQNPIDAFIQSRLQQERLAQSSEADRRTLIRRVYYDLTGLPPTPEEVDAFLADQDPHAWEQIVDQLLESPRYGERWARHWLDTIHFADSHGYEHDVGRDNAWPFRDYVINAFNSDKSWSRFIREQLATDVFYPEETDLTPALGFLGAGTFDLSTFSTAPVTFSYLDRDDLVAQTMSAFVSTTANCARCHAHKFDPITQEDYYALQAVFAGLLKGEISYDRDPDVAHERHRLQSLIKSAEQRDGAVLLDPANAAMLASWVANRGDGATWQSLTPETFLSTEGTSLTLTPEKLILAGGTSPEKDTYIVSAATDIDKITALRLDVFPHESLPSNGPGRSSNGNLHLSEIQLQIFAPGADKGTVAAIKRATADFNQANWGIERASDGNAETAWGIHPEVAKRHHGVFELTEPLMLTPGTRLVVTLKQLHGRSHLIGAFNLSVTSDEAAQAIALPAEVDSALRTPADEQTSEQRLLLAATALRVEAESALKRLPLPENVYAAGSSVMVPSGNGAMQAHALAEPKVVHVLQRGDFDKPRNVENPGALSALTHEPARFRIDNPQHEASRRAALANWFAHPENVLTWRSIVNRVWHYHFGRGLCDTPSDFGRMGGVPTHPELLNWLAVWFRDDANGSLKQLHRLIVTSETYRQSSRHRDDGAGIDGDNRLLWRQNRHRLDADSYRDFTLAVAGSLDLSMGGPGVQHFKQSKGIQSTPVLDYTAFEWNTPGASRRSIYRYVWRGIADPFMEALDFPDLGLLSPTRSFSASSLQALALYNNDFVLHHAERMATQIQKENHSLESQIRQAVRLVWLREPTIDEMQDYCDVAGTNGLPAFCRLLLNSNEFLFVD